MNERAIPQRCSTCAFTSGTPANRSEITLLKAKLCVQACESFYCHENIHPDGTLPPGEERLCTGFVDAMTMLNAKGFYDRQPEYQRRVWYALLRVIDEVETRAQSNDPMNETEMSQSIRSAVITALDEYARETGKTPPDVGTTLAELEALGQQSLLEGVA